MNTTSSLPTPAERATCVQCHGELPVVFLRQVTADPPAYACRNEAACRKRQRHWEARAAAKKAAKGGKP